jgi:MinD superfamily P-loop ATPase
MPYQINAENCIECGQCRRYCPIKGAIIINQEYQHTIVADLCSGCGLCEAFCPLPNAIVLTNDKPTYHSKRLKALRRVVWRGKWGYHQHPLMSPVTAKARQTLRAVKRLERYTDSARMMT